MHFRDILELKNRLYFGIELLHPDARIYFAFFSNMNRCWKSRAVPIIIIIIIIIIIFV